MKFAVVLLLAACGGHPAPAPKPVAKPDPAIWKPVEGPAPITTLTPDVVVAKIRAAYMGGVKRCYSVMLKNSGGRGKVMVTFTVDPTGRVHDGTARGFSDTVDACITAQVADWRFPIPTDPAGTPVEASFALPLDLIPD